jgi:hypothetical protein
MQKHQSDIAAAGKDLLAYRDIIGQEQFLQEARGRVNLLVSKAG